MVSYCPLSPVQPALGPCIGGVGTLTGTDLNLYLAGFHADMYKTYKEVTEDGNTIELSTNNGTGKFARLYRISIMYFV